MEFPIAYLHAELRNGDIEQYRWLALVDVMLIQLALGGLRTPQQARQQRAWILWLWIDGRSPWQLT